MNEIKARLGSLHRGTLRNIYNVSTAAYKLLTEDINTLLYELDMANFRIKELEKKLEDK